MVTIMPEPLGGFPEAWQAHESYAWEAQARESGPFDHLLMQPPTRKLRGWTTCSCGFVSYPDKNSGLPPLTYAEAHQAYIDHLPPGLAAWLVKRQNAPRDNAERIKRLRELVDGSRENGATSLSIDAVEEALGVFR